MGLTVYLGSENVAVKKTDLPALVELKLWWTEPNMKQVIWFIRRQALWREVGREWRELGGRVMLEF